MATGATPIDYQSPLSGGLLQDLLGRQTTGSQNSNTLTANLMQQLMQAQTAGSTTQQQSGTTTTSANTDPLQAVFASGMAGMTPDVMKNLISSIFQEGAQGVPSLIGSYANATGSRATGNSGLQLALGDLNKNLSTQAMQAMLNYNQQGQQNAANAASQIAANTRATTNTGNQTGTQQQSNTQNTNQTQTGATQQQQQTQTRQSVNPSMAGLLGLGGTALNFLGKTPWGKQLLGQGGTSAATPTIGTAAPMGGITGAVGSAAPSYGALTTPSPSAGYLATPASIGGGAPGASAFGGTGGGASSVFGGTQLAPSVLGITNATGGIAPAWGGGSGIGSYDPLSGATDYFGTGNFWGGNNADVFDIGSTGSLGSNIPQADWGIDYSGMSGGILGQQFAADEAANTALLSGGGGGFSDAFSGIGGFLGDAWDTVSSWFANGGFVNPQRSNPTVPLANQINSYRPGGYANGGMVRTMESSLVGSPTDPVQFVPGGVARSTFNDLSLGMAVPGVDVVRGFADGGQISTGGSVRNRNNMGAPQRRQQSGAINYEGYAPSAANAGGGGSIPMSTTIANVAAGAAPVLAGGGQQAFIAPQSQQQQQTSQAMYVDPAIQMMEAMRAQQETAARIAIAQQGAIGGTMGGSGGVGEGAAPTGNEADNASAGIGPSGAAAAPTGTSAAVSQGLSALGIASPLPIALQMMLLQQIVQQMHTAPLGIGSGPGNTDNDVVGINSSVTLDALSPNSSPVGVGGDAGNNVGASSSDNASGDGSVGSGAGSSGTSGTGDSPGDGWKNGGLVRGPGTSTSDSIRVKSKEPGGKDIAYSDGEFVIPPDVVAHFGAGTFQSIIDGFHSTVR